MALSSGSSRVSSLSACMARSASAAYGWGRIGGVGREHLFDAVFGGGTEAQSVRGHKMKRAQQHVRIVQGVGLLQIDQPVHNGEVRVGEARAPVLELAIERRPRSGNLLKQLLAYAVYRTGL